MLEDPELMKEFVVESQEHLADVENQLLTLEAQADEMDVALVNTVFRAVHSIKGAAGFLGLETLGTLAHREEEVLNKLRNRELRPTSVVINTLLRATDRLKSLLDAIDSSNDQDVSDHIAALERILRDEPAEDSPVAEAAPAEAACEPAAVEPVAETTTADPAGSEGGVSEALREFLIESSENLEQFERDLMALEREPAAEEPLRSMFRAIHTIKGTAGFLAYGKLEQVTHAAENLLSSVRSGQFPFDGDISGLMFATIDAVRKCLETIEKTGAEGSFDPSELKDRLVKLHEQKQAGQASPQPVAPAAAVPAAPVASPAATTTAATKPIEAPTPTPEATKPAAPAPPKPAAAATEKPAAPAADQGSVTDSTIRVDVALLDKLMTRVGELVLARNQMLQCANVSGDSELQATSQRLNLITTELQEGVMKTRMQPIGNVWSKFPRLVRDLAAACEKQVRIEMEGKETDLDKTIIEAIKDPLTHLVRNSVDHGIERPEVRLQKGKPAEGCLTLRAYHEGGQVNIEICDDGAGLNLERIKQKAIERGLVTPDQALHLSDREAALLIFLPGFSTAEKVSAVSGRGVGMDVVKTNIEKIGGAVDVQTQTGFGSTIKIKIPLTLAIVPALIVTSDHDRYAIPQVNLLELVRLDGEQSQNAIEWIQGAPVYRLRGRLLPLVFLGSELKTQPPPSAQLAERDVVNIVVLRADDRQFGLVVDRVNDTEEIVVKPLSKQLKGIDVYAGTTIRGDGKVALILDVLGLAHAAHVLVEGRDRAHLDSHDRSAAKSSNCQTLLVLGVGADRRVALPISQVARLEKIWANDIETADGQEVVQYRGEILPLVRLENVVGATPAEVDDDTPLNVVVYTENHHSIGLVVDRIIDIVETTLENTRPSRHEGLLGSAVIHEHVTDLLDLAAIVRQADPSFVAEPQYA